MNELIVKGGGCGGGKSYANAHCLFNNWLVTKFNPLPESEMLWELTQVFGEYCGMCMPITFEGNDIELKDL